jgi:UDP-glucose 4-epimerase
MSPDLPFREDGDLLLGPSMIKRWSYAVSKLHCEQMAFAYYKDYSVPIVILRYFGGFSPRSNFSWSGGHIPIFVDAILNDKEVSIHGDGKQTRSMAYVDDLIEGTCLAMESDRAIGEIFNLGNDEEMSVLDAAILIHKIASTGKELKLKYIKMEEIFGQYKDIIRRRPDLTKAQNILGYRPKISMEEAVRRIVDLRRKEVENRNRREENSRRNLIYTAN